MINLFEFPSSSFFFFVQISEKKKLEMCQKMFVNQISEYRKRPKQMLVCQIWEYHEINWTLNVSV